MPDNPLDSVLLDVDGTLIDSTYQHALAWHRAFASHDLAIPMWRLHRAIGMGGDRLVAAAAGEHVEARLGDALRDGWQREYENLLPELNAFDGASALLAELHDRGWRVGLATSGKPDHTHAALELFGGEGPIEGWTTADDAAESKPAPDILRAALDQIGGRAAVCVGDSTYDVEAAAAVGWRCVAVRTGGFGIAELYEAGAVGVFEDVADLLDRLDKTSPAEVPRRARVARRARRRQEPFSPKSGRGSPSPGTRPARPRRRNCEHPAPAPALHRHPRAGRSLVSPSSVWCR